MHARSRDWRRLALQSSLILVVPLAVVSAGCGKSTEAQGPPDPKEQAIPVRVVQPEHRPMQDTLALTATVEADISVEIFAKTTGRCIGIHTDTSSAVAVGTLLVSLDSEEAQLTERQADIRRRKSEQDLARSEAMRDQNLLSAELYQSSHLTFEEAEAAHAIAKIALTETAIRAPVAGTVVERYCKVGDLISPTTPLMRIVDFGTLETVVFVPEHVLPRLRIGLPARLHADALPDSALLASVSEISPIVDPTSGTVAVTVALPADTQLRPGMFVRVSLVLDEHPDALALPALALVTEGGAYSVYVVRDSVAERIPVTVGLRDTGWVEVFGDIGPADQVVTEGLFRLEPGTRVRIVKAPTA